MMEENNITVTIVEDDPEIRQMLSLIIDRSPGFSCKHAFGDCEGAIEPVMRNRPDVVLMDIGLPRMSGIEAVRLLKESMPDTDFIMLTIQDDDNSVFDSLCAGATGYLLKDTPPAELLQSIREVRNGGAPMTPSIARRIAGSFRRSVESPLSSRETEVLQKLCNGDNYKTIADSLFISGNTVRAHIKSIYRKLHVTSRAQAVSTALRDKLV
ncbi:MAG: response regulator transcription factor [Bacteroidetes bacterium]|nr:response regulator transcription factor [Bacteroidota bacterium]MCW5895466.1 response regulator transcription factor [Bacteroidota bacterium]